MAISTLDIAWLAGLIEGEGCFSRQGNCVTMQLNMADRDVVERASRLMGAHSVGADNPRKDHHKTLYRTMISGPKAAAWMMTLYSLMGERRRARIRELLPLFMRSRKQNPTVMVCAHIERHRKGRQVCSRCYQTAWARQDRAKRKAAGIQ